MPIARGRRQIGHGLTPEPTRHALQDLFTTAYGLMSAGVLIFTLGMGVFIARYMARHIREDGERAAREAAAPR